MPGRGSSHANFLRGCSGRESASIAGQLLAEAAELGPADGPVGLRIEGGCLGAELAKLPGGGGALVRVVAGEEGEPRGLIIHHADCDS